MTCHTIVKSWVPPNSLLGHKSFVNFKKNYVNRRENSFGNNKIGTQSPLLHERKLPGSTKKVAQLTQADPGGNSPQRIFFGNNNKIWI